MRAFCVLAFAVAACGLPPSSIVCAGDLLVSSRFNSHVLRYDANTGTFVGVFASGHGMANPNGIAYGPDGNLYVANGDEGRVLRFDGQTGDFLGSFVSPSTPGGLASPRAIAFGPDGNLYVDSGGTNNVLAYDGATGAFLRVAAQGNGIVGPVGLTFGPNGNLFVAGALSNGVYVFDPAGNFIRSFNCGEDFANPTGVLFDPGGRLLMAQSVTNVVLAGDASAGTCQGIAASGGGLSAPIGLIMAPDGTLLTGSFNNDSVIKYDLTTTHAIATFIPPGSGGLDGTHNFAYVPNPSCAQIPPGALHWWPADGTARDLRRTAGHAEPRSIRLVFDRALVEDVDDGSSRCHAGRQERMRRCVHRLRHELLLRALDRAPSRRLPGPGQRLRVPVGAVVRRPGDHRGFAMASRRGDARHRRRDDVRLRGRRARCPRPADRRRRRSARGR
jgi:streptogramin lyase